MIVMLGWWMFFSIWLLVGDRMVMMGYFCSWGLLFDIGIRGGLLFGMALVDSMVAVDVLPDGSVSP